MTGYLSTLRQTLQTTPQKFLAAHPGCWVQYCDDTQTKDSKKALSSHSFNATVARRKQLQGCGVFFSLQAFGKARTKEEVLSFRNLGVDVDLISPAERARCDVQEIDRRKEEYLAHYLLPFPLKPHWLIETRHGFHAIFRVMPQRVAAGIREGIALNQQLVGALRGDEKAALLTQVLRVPNTYQFKQPKQPFLCRLLVDNSSTIAPYDFAALRSVLDAWEVFHGTGPAQSPRDAGDQKQPHKLRDGLAGVPEGQRNATAASARMSWPVPLRDGVVW